MARDFDDRDDLNGEDLGGQRMDARGGGRRLRRRKPRRNCPDYIDWKDVDFLKQFLPERGKILPRRISGVNADCQRRIATAIKRARNMALLPYTTD